MAIHNVGMKRRSAKRGRNAFLEDVSRRFCHSTNIQSLTGREVDVSSTQGQNSPWGGRVCGGIETLEN